MDASTLKAIRALAAADPAKGPAQRGRLLAAIGLLTVPETENAGGLAEGSRIVSFAEAARRLAASKRNVHQLCATGLLTKVTLPGRKLARGVTVASLNRLFAAGAVPTEGGR